MHFSHIVPLLAALTFRFLVLANAGEARQMNPNSPETRRRIREDFGFFSATVEDCSGFGLFVNDNRWPSHRFEVVGSPPVVVDTVGGFFSSEDMTKPITLFAAITKLADSGDFPNSFDLTSDDVVATTTFDILPDTCGDISTPLNIKLKPGWYSLTFGTGAFGASSFGGFDLFLVRAEKDAALSQRPFVFFVGEGFAPQFATPRFLVNGWVTEGCPMFFELADAEDDEIQDLSPDPVLDLGDFRKTRGTFDLNIHAQFSTGGNVCNEVGSVLLVYTSEDGSDDHEQCENDPPYLLLGDKDGDIYGFTPTLGSKVLTATAYRGADCQPLSEVDMEVTEIEVVYTPPPLEIILIRADNGAEISEIRDGIIFNLAKLPPELNIRAKFVGFDEYDPIPDDTLLPGSSVEFLLNGKEQRVENVSPYMAGGDSPSSIFDFSDTLRELVNRQNENVLTVQVNEKLGGAGDVLFEHEVAFFVVDEKELESPPASG